MVMEVSAACHKNEGSREAVTQFPVEDKEQKGKVIDVVPEWVFPSFLKRQEGFL